MEVMIGNWRRGGEKERRKRIVDFCEIFSFLN
jgi:hypothetical protein